MIEVTVHPNVYATGPSAGLPSLLEKVWVRNHRPGDGTMYIVSGFANYNGGVRFFDTFREHIGQGGRIVAIFSGSANSRLTSKQVVSELLECGVDVHIVSRKRILHAKCYGISRESGDSLIVTSGNFTGPGMSQNVEMSVLLDEATASGIRFTWDGLTSSLLAQNWDFYRPTLDALDGPGWRILYDERVADPTPDDSQQTTMVLLLGHTDTVRINAEPGSRAERGTPYFWLSKNCVDFFPPLTIRNRRGRKTTYSCVIRMKYVDLNIENPDCRVTFEAENNVDFRLGTTMLKGTRIASPGDLAAISRIGEDVYETRIIRKEADAHSRLLAYAVNRVGHKGKRYGYIANTDFERVMELRLGRG